MKKSVKISIIVILLLLVAIGLFIWNALHGNPVSEAKAEKAAEIYLTEQYADTDYVIDELLYDFKLGQYFANVSSPTSIDTHFDNAITSSGKVIHDSFDDVTSGWNTHQRINEAYGELVDKVFTSKDFPLHGHIDFGIIEAFDPDIEPSFDEADYGVILSDLILDHAYDVRELGKTTGHIIYYEEDEDVSFEHAKESLIIIKQKLAEADIPFYAIDYTLEKPREEGKAFDEDSPIIHVANFLSDDIEENMSIKEIEEAHEALKAHYQAADAAMEEE